jgi:lipopolysaccharide transport system permease protein
VPYVQHEPYIARALDGCRGFGYPPQTRCHRRILAAMASPDTSAKARRTTPEAGTASMVHPAGSRRAAIRRSLDVLVSLTVSDLKVRYGRGRWRLVKWIADPFALVGVYLALVTLVLDRPGKAPGLSLACAVIPFQLFTTTIVNAMSAIAARRSIVLNMGFNRTLLPLSAVLTETVAFAASLLLLVLMMAVYGVAPTLASLWLPVVIVVTLILSAGVAYPAALLGIWMPEIGTFVMSFVRVLFFIAPGLVPLSQISGTAHDLLLVNPLTGLFESYRDALLYGDSPGVVELLYPAAVGVVLLLAFVPLFRAEQRQFAKIMET